MKRCFYSLYFAFVFFVLHPIFSGNAADSSLHPIEHDLQAVDQDLNREKRLLETLKKQSTSLLQALSDIDRQLLEAESKQVDVQRKSDALQQSLSEKQKKRQEAALLATEIRARLRTHLRALYKMGDVGWMNLLFQAESVDETLRRLRWFERMTRTEQLLISRYEQSEEDLLRCENSLNEENNRLQQLSKESLHQQRDVASIRSMRMKALGWIQGQEELHKKAILELRNAQLRLTQLLLTIEGGNVTDKGFKSWMGRLHAPIAAGVVEAGFGKRVDPRFNTITTSQGVDIRATKGESVKAIYPGTVVFSDVFQGYGRLIILDHGEGYYSLYGQLDRFLVSKGNRVTMDQPIGTVGDTGSLKGTYLYFEIREKGKAVDPARWVNLRF
jgi:murein hydrolase activator